MIGFSPQALKTQQLIMC